MSRYPSRPVAAVGVVVLREDAERCRVLLVKRGKEPRAGQWSIPGGRQQLGEKLEEAARREVREETGLAIRDLQLLEVVDSIMRDASGRVEYHYSLIDFSARWRAGEAAPGSDAVEVRWVDPDELDAFGLWKETRRLIERALALP
jgi:ADP-ribose pyrophosphatase YjhB (NUDIX family)